MEKVPSAPATATPPGFLHHGARKAGLPAYTGDGAGNPAATEHHYGHDGAANASPVSISRPAGRHPLARRSCVPVEGDGVAVGVNAPLEHPLKEAYHVARLDHLSASTIVPRPTRMIPNQSLRTGRSPRNSTANMATSTTLDLSMGATFDASPICSALK